MRISDWSSDVCSSDLCQACDWRAPGSGTRSHAAPIGCAVAPELGHQALQQTQCLGVIALLHQAAHLVEAAGQQLGIGGAWGRQLQPRMAGRHQRLRLEEHTSELQSLMRISYAVFCLKKHKTQ